MTVNLTLTLPDAVEGLFKSQPEQISEAIERAVRKALSRQLEVKAVIEGVISPSLADALIGKKLYSEDTWGNSMSITVEEVEGDDNYIIAKGTNPWGGKNGIYIEAERILELLAKGSTNTTKEVDGCTVKTTYSLKNDEPTDREAEALEAYRQELAENGRPDMSREAWIANYLETH